MTRPNSWMTFIALLLALSGCDTLDTPPDVPEGVLSVAQLRANPVYDAEVEVYGKVEDDEFD